MSLEGSVILVCLFTAIVLVSQYKLILEPAFDHIKEQMQELNERLKNLQPEPPTRSIKFQDRSPRPSLVEKSSEELTKEAVTKSVVSDKKRLTLEEVNDQLHRLA
jgi:type II secretory pathway component PulM